MVQVSSHYKKIQMGRVQAEKQKVGWHCSCCSKETCQQLTILGFVQSISSVVNQQGLYDVMNPNWLPTLYLGHHEEGNGDEVVCKTIENVTRYMRTKQAKKRNIKCRC